MFTIETKRLGFVPLTKEAIESAIKGEEELQKFLGLSVSKGLIEPIHMERVFPVRLEKLTRDPEISKWYGFVVEKDSNQVIGMMGFKTPPNENGIVEIGYGIHSSYQGNGYATEMAQGLKEWAFSFKEVIAITATGILKENIASIKVVEKLGMVLFQQAENTLDYMIEK